MIYGYARVSTKGQAKDGNSLGGKLYRITMLHCVFTSKEVI